MFQYSLCRIVYCCCYCRPLLPAASPCFNIRSVESCTAAPTSAPMLLQCKKCFNIRSVESCTAARAARVAARGCAEFQYSLCRIVYCCSCVGCRPALGCITFQYSLCRIVYCCKSVALQRGQHVTFQYSLCRIVYCCFDKHLS